MIRRLVFLAAGSFFLCPAAGFGAGDAVTSAPVVAIPVEVPAEDMARSEGSTDLFVQEVGLLRPEHLVSFDLNKMWQVTENSFNWHGVADCSLVCDVGFTPNAVVCVGELSDDVPFVQTRLNALMPAGAALPYGADGIEFEFESVTSSTRRARIVLDFGSACSNPRMMLAESFSPINKGCIKDAMVTVLPASGDRVTTHFEFAISYEDICDPRFFNVPFRVTCRLHDIDGAPETYKQMSQTQEKR